MTLQAVYAEMELDLSFRKMERTTDRMPVLSAWLRQGELAAQSAVVGEFDPKTFAANLETIRTFTRETPEIFIPKMKRLCSRPN